MDKQKRAKMMRFIGIVCWFLALFMLFDGHQKRKLQEAEEAKQNAIVMEMEENMQNGEAVDSTLIFPSE
ncbi:MAG: hypothetical protein Q4C06_01575 [Bacillota bacterium]|nr:hypothetical protein [Bacillota bacterium]